MRSFLMVTPLVLVACSSHPSDQDLRSHLVDKYDFMATFPEVRVGSCMRLPAPVAGRTAEECEVAVTMKPTPAAANPSDQLLRSATKSRVMVDLQLSLEARAALRADEVVEVKGRAIFVETVDHWAVKQMKFDH